MPLNQRNSIRALFEELLVLLIIFARLRDFRNKMLVPNNTLVIIKGHRKGNRLGYQYVKNRALKTIIDSRAICKAFFLFLNMLLILNYEIVK